MHQTDVHIILPPSWTDQSQRWYDQCMDSLKDEPINIHRIDFVDGDIRKARLMGFSKGTAPYVSFVDPDDYVYPGIFAKCETALNANIFACGAFTLSDIIEIGNDGVENNRGKMRDFQPWPMRRIGGLTDIHQLVVMRRNSVLRVFDNHYNRIPPIVHEMTWVYWEMAKEAPWVPLDVVGYAWRRHAKGAHCIISDEIRDQLRRCSDHMLNIRRQLTANIR